MCCFGPIPDNTINAYGKDPWFLNSYAAEDQLYEPRSDYYQPTGQYGDGWPLSKRLNFFLTRFEGYIVLDILVKSVISAVCLAFQIIEASVVTALVVTVTPFLLLSECCCPGTFCGAYFITGMELLSIIELFLEVIGHIFVAPFSRCCY